MIDVIVSKRCTKCMEVKPMHAFRIDLVTGDGYKSACKKCMNAADARRYLERKERGVVRSRKVERQDEPLWPLPTHTLQEGLACVQLRKWRGPVSAGLLRGAL